MCETISNNSGFTCANRNVSDTTTFTYNGDGLRMAAVNPPSGTTTQCTWDVSGSVPRLLQAGSSLDYLYGPNVGAAPIEQITAGGTTHNYLVSDPTGVRDLISSGGSVAATVSYNSYGVPSSSLFSLFGFEGGLTDSNGFIYLINRYYEPTTGQFISVDPDAASTGEPYAFVEDDPVNKTDENGLFESGPNGQACIGDVCNWDEQNTSAMEHSTLVNSLRNLALSKYMCGEPSCGPGQARSDAISDYENDTYVDLSKIPTVDDVFQSVTLSTGLCFLYCVGASVQGGTVSVQHGGFGLAAPGISVGFANLPACRREGSSQGGSIGVFGASQGISPSGAVTNNDWEYDFGKDFGFSAGTSHSNPIIHNAIDFGGASC